MKYGVYYAYWETQWAADYVKYCKKVKNLGFDILEIAGGGGMFPKIWELRLPPASAFRQTSMSPLWTRASGERESTI